MIFLLAFLEGLALILSPCILPMLPIMLSSGLGNDKNHSYGMIIGFITFFTLFAIAGTAISSYIPEEYFRWISTGILILLGSSMLLNLDIIDLKLSFSDSLQPKRNILSGLLVGLSLSLLWAPCAGPIIIATMVQMSTQTLYLYSTGVFLSFALGVMLPMIGIVFISKAGITMLKGVNKHMILIKRVCGAIIILSTILNFI